MRVERERMCNSDRLCSRGYVLQCWFGLWRCSLLCSVLLFFPVSNEEACPLTWIRDPLCTAADGSSANECGAGASFFTDDGASLGIEAETGTCVEELQA